MIKFFKIILGFSLWTSSLHAASFSNIYVIGDSLSDQGNLRKATLILSNGNDERPASDHYFQGRFSNGEVYSELLAQQLGLSLTSSLEGGNNFAFGGTRSNYNRIEINAATPFNFPDGIYAPDTFNWTLETQRQAFEAKNIFDPNALFVVWSGSNDVGDWIGPTLASHGAFNISPFLSEAIQETKNVIDTYIDSGARTIIVPNIADLGLVPRVAALNPPGSLIVTETATALTQAYNIALNNLLDQYSDIDIIRFDIFNLLRDITEHPKTFGFTNAKSPCYTGFVIADTNGEETVCNSEETYVFWDSEHPTTKFHDILAKQMLTTLLPEPDSLLLFLFGLIVLYSRKTHIPSFIISCQHNEHNKHNKT